MKTEKAKRSEITIAGHKVEVFQLPDGEYVMSQTQATKPINKGNNSIIRFLTNLTSESLQAEASAIIPIQIEGNNRPIQAIPLTVVSAFWMMQAGSGNKAAEALTYACIVESLERRCDAVFKVNRTENEYENRTRTSYKQYWDNERDYLKGCHRPFEMACWRLKASPTVMHNELTKLVTGMVAREHRQLDLPLFCHSPG